MGWDVTASAPIDGTPGLIGDAWREYKRTKAHDARNQLVLHYSPIVKYTVGRMRSKLPLHVDESDLISCGVFGLLDAIDKFDPAMGVKFETYAPPRIRGAVLDEFRSVDWVPRSVRAKASAIEHTEERLQAELKRTPASSELASALGTSEDQLRIAHSQIARSKVAALDQLLSSDDSVTLGEAIADATYEPSELCEVDETKELVAKALDRLSERERFVMTRYYYEGLTLAQIAKQLDVTESRVCQIHGQALRRLRERSKVWGLGSDHTRDLRATA